ncbi:rhomboid family intramembrane serine protease [Iodobacter arcticus]|uniref:Rhomboid family intramembrane serine protease n=1 Tax=Iodobacter arcticus TaxID=590593 RepID=A0ABW2QZD0_9NEIS
MNLSDLPSQGDLKNRWPFSMKIFSVIKEFSNSHYPIPYISIVLALACIGLYGYQQIIGLPWELSPEQQISWGGNLAALTLTGEYWRLFTSMFLHEGLIHLLLNMYLLMMVGPRTEHQFGRVGMFAIYLVGGVSASCMSAWWLGSHAIGTNFLGLPSIRLVVSIGASGAIMALCGALLSGFAMDRFNGKRGNEEPGFGRALAQVVGLNLVMGLFVSNTDQAAHVGGLIAGGAVGLLIGHVTTDHNKVMRVVRLALTPLLAGLAAWWALSASDVATLQELRADMETTKHEEQKARTEIQEKKAREAAIIKERQQRPPQVDADTARGKVIKVSESGASFVLSEDETKAYVVDLERNQISVVDLVQGVVEKRIAGPKLPVQTEEKVGCYSLKCSTKGALDIQVMRDSSLALVTAMEKNAVTFIDLSAAKRVATVRVGAAPHAIVLSPDQSRAYVHNTQDNTISVLDIATKKVLSVLTVSNDKNWKIEDRLPMWFSADGVRLYVHNKSDHQISVFDTQTLRPLDDVTFAQLEHIVAPKGVKGAVWGLSDDGIFISDGFEPTAKKTIPFCNSITAFTAAGVSTGAVELLAVAIPNYANKGTFVRVANVGSTVSVGQYPLHGYVTELLFSADGKRLFSLTSSGDLSIIDPRKRMDDDDLLCKPVAT